MSNYFYNGQLNPKNSLPIYKYSENSEKNCISDLLIARGYIDGAKHIIHRLKDFKNHSPNHDYLVYPLLNLYFCTIEFLLKQLLKRIQFHTINEKCPFIEEGLFKEKEIKKLLGGHKIKNIFNQIEKILSIKNNPHIFENIQFLKNLIYDMGDNGIDSLSTRYHHDKDGNTYPLFYEQKNIRIYKLHEDISKIEEDIQSYIDNNTFSLCRAGCYTKKYLGDLEYTLSVCKKYRPLLNYNIKSDKSDKSEEYLVKTISDVEIDRPPSFPSEFKTIKKQELAALVMGIYIANITHECSPNINLLKKSNSSELKEKIVNTRLIRDPINAIENEINKIKPYAY